MRGKIQHKHIRVGKSSLCISRSCSCRVKLANGTNLPILLSLWRLLNCKIAKIPISSAQKCLPCLEKSLLWGTHNSQVEFNCCMKCCLEGKVVLRKETSDQNRRSNRFYWCNLMWHFYASTELFLLRHNRLNLILNWILFLIDKRVSTESLIISTINSKTFEALFIRHHLQRPVSSRWAFGFWMHQGSLHTQPWEQRKISQRIALNVQFLLVTSRRSRSNLILLWISAGGETRTSAGYNKPPAGNAQCFSESSNKHLNCLKTMTSIKNRR